MIRRAVLAGLFAAAVPLAGGAQTFSPQSSAGLTVSFTTERAGGSRVIVFGDIRNATNNAAEHVVILAEGLDEGGRVLSRGRCYVAGTVPPRGSAPFEIRLSSGGSEKKYRVQVEAFQFQFLQGN